DLCGIATTARDFGVHRANGKPLEQGAGSVLGTGDVSYGRTTPRVPMIGKTGTTDGNKDTWMSGASRKVATVVGVVSLTGDMNQRATYFDRGQAATARHRMWPAVMSVANAKYGGKPHQRRNACSSRLLS
ncbi:MAG: Penicillin-binding protein, partial [Cryobacterium sp.]|nr:Penicillin-binding protein [Cryobacterium sp.]